MAYNLTQEEDKSLQWLTALEPKEPQAHLDENGQDLFALAKESARVLTEDLGITGSTVVLSLATPYVIKGIVTPEECAKRFSPEIQELLHDMQRVDSLIVNDENVKDKEFSGFIVSMARDIRVIIALIVNCYVRMNAIKDEPVTPYALRLANSSRHFYAPLSHKLGLYEIKRDLEDLAVKFEDPEAYERITQSLQKSRKQRDEYLRQVVDRLQQRITGIGFEYTVKYRTKSIHSIYAKMTKKGIDLDGIYDLYALRIIVKAPRELELAACWAMFGLTTSVFVPNLLRTRDWITRPRESGYESLHTTVLGPDNHWVEVQIRSERMDEEAECGQAAHWRYKGEDGHDAALNDALLEIRRALESHADMETVRTGFAQDIYGREIFVFDNADRLHKVSSEARVIDYIIQIAPEADWVELFSGAEVNGIQRPLDFVLNNGDHVKLTAKL